MPAAAAGISAITTYVSLHTADPGAGGTSEVTGGLTRLHPQAHHRAAASSGSVASKGSDPVFDVPAVACAAMAPDTVAWGEYERDLPVLVDTIDHALTTR